MATTVGNMIFLGRFADVDTDESNYSAESPNTLLGTYDAFSDLAVVAVTNHDQNDDGAISDNETRTSDFVTYTRNGTNYTAKSDSTLDMWVRVTDTDGVVHTIEVVGIQMTNGDLFITDLNNAGTLDNLTIRSVEIYSIPSTNFSGYLTNQTVSNTTVCFASGTLIATQRGNVQVETLLPGDLLRTADRGLQPLRWIWGATHRAPGNAAPIEFAPASLGDAQPDMTLRVSPQHRIVVHARVVHRMFGVDQAMLPAKRFLGLPGVTQAKAMDPVCYWHLLCDQHEVIFANGAPTETLLLGPVAWRSLDSDARAQIRGLFNVSEKVDGLLPSIQPARLIPPAARQRQLIQRMIKNSRTQALDGSSDSSVLNARVRALAR